MGADIKMTNGSALRSARKLRPNLQNAVRTGVEQFVKRDWIPTVKRPGFGFQDRSGDLRRSVRIGVKQEGDTTVAALTSSEAYAPEVEERRGGRFSFADRSFRQQERQLPKRVDAEVQRFIRKENRSE